MATRVNIGERENLLDEDAANSLGLAAAVERLRAVQTDVEALIQALANTGSAHRAYERSRIRLSKHLAGGQSSAALTGPGHLTARGH